MATPIPIPPSFVDLTTAFAQDDPCNVIGIVVDFLPAARSRGPDWTIKFTLHDPTWFEGLGLEVRYFRKDAKSLPAVTNHGDVVILRNLKCKAYTGGGLRCGLSNGSTTWVVLDGHSISDSADENGKDIKFEKSQIAGAPSAAELRYAKWLYLNSDPATFQPLQRPTALQVEGIIQASGGTAPGRREKFSLLKDLAVSDNQQMSFCDILVEVRRVFKNDFRVELYVSDYTTNEALYPYVSGRDEDGTEGDRFGYVTTGPKKWPGPWGKMTMNVALWDANAAFAQKEVSEGDYVLLKNVSLKTGKTSCWLEGHCRGDRHNPTRVNVVPMSPKDAQSDEKMTALLKRRREYEKTARAQHHRFLGDLRSRKRKADNESEEQKAETEQKGEVPINPKASKNRRKRENKKAKKEACAAGADVAVQKVAAPPKSNVHVKCEKVDVPLSTIDDIVNIEMLKRKTAKGNEYYLPFQNCCYKSKVRVVDFLPHDLADFCQPHRRSVYDELDLSDHDSDIDTDPELTQSGEAEVVWKWCFALIVVDAGPPLHTGQSREELVLMVADDDGDYLLRDMDACDLRQNSTQLKKLRDKLWTLWGDLEDCKADAAPGQDYGGLAKSLPFECLIKEYGVRTRDEKGQLTKDVQYERMFRIFKTTVT